MISLQQFTIKKESEGNNSATFSVGPLPHGYGHTLGTFLRRVLLSSVPGSSITGVKIDGVEHEYSSLEGVSDDVLALLLSLKNVVLVSKSLTPVTVELTATGKAGEVVEVTAGDIEETNEVRVANKDYVITRLTGKTKLNVVLTVERGTGYVLPNEDVRKEVSTLPLDANFSPVKLVNYTVSQTRVGKETELDQLDIQIETNGAVTPEEALHVAADSLNQMTSHLIEISTSMLKGDEVTVAVQNEIKKAASESKTASDETPVRVADLNLSTRLTNALMKSNYDDLRKLAGLTEEEVASIRGMGSKSYQELLDVLKKYNVKLV